MPRGKYPRHKTQLDLMMHNDLQDGFSHGPHSPATPEMQKLYTIYINMFRNNYNNDGTLKPNRYPVTTDLYFASRFVSLIKMDPLYSNLINGERLYWCPSEETGWYDYKSHLSYHKPAKSLKFNVKEPIDVITTE